MILINAMSALGSGPGPVSLFLPPGSSSVRPRLRLLHDLDAEYGRTGPALGPSASESTVQVHNDRDRE